MLLVVDIGNTCIKSAVFDGKVFIEKFSYPSCKNPSDYNYKKDLKNFVEKFKVTECVICSVSEVTCKLFTQVCIETGIKTEVITPSSFFDLKINVENPQTVGTDRLCNVYALKDKYKKPVIVTDIGTAITFDIMLPQGVFIGGIIMAGINAQLKTLNLSTSQLPEINIGKAVYAIGNSTEKAILSGVLRGTASAIDGLISQCNKELGEEAVLIGCGGQAELISQYMTHKFNCINYDLTLQGLVKVFQSLHNKIC